MPAGASGPGGGSTDASGPGGGERRCKQNGRRRVRMRVGRAAASTSAGTASGRERVEDLAAGPLAPAVGDLGHAR